MKQRNNGGVRFTIRATGVVRNYFSKGERFVFDKDRLKLKMVPDRDRLSFDWMW